jgi:hypothetical protein
MNYVIVAMVIIGFIWLVYTVRKSTKKKASGEWLFDKLVNDPRFKNDPKFREQALNRLKDFEQYHQSVEFEQNIKEEFAKGGNFIDVLDRLAKKRGWGK